MGQLAIRRFQLAVVGERRFKPAVLCEQVSGSRFTLQQGLGGSLLILTSLRPLSHQLTADVAKLVAKVEDSPTVALRLNGQAFLTVLHGCQLGLESIAFSPGLMKRGAEAIELGSGRGSNPALPNRGQADGAHHSSSPNTLGAVDENSWITLPILLEYVAVNAMTLPAPLPCEPPDRVTLSSGA